jgi:hypothetical protein
VNKAAEQKSGLSGTRLLRFIAKTGISALALFYVSQKIDFRETWGIITAASLPLLMFGILLFNVSKVVSTWRVKYFLACVGADISPGYNIVVYYIGAFYNIFLPGSIGGDAYKVQLLRKKTQVSVGESVSVVFLDRLSGMVALVFITLSLGLLVPLSPSIPHFKVLLMMALLMLYPAYWLFLYFLFKKFKPAFHSTNIISMVTQLLQVACAWSLLLSLGMESHGSDYITLFMLSSVVSVIPFTIGGLGAREVVFLWGMQFLAVDRHLSVAFTLLFFTVTAVSSFAGLFLTFRNDA